MAFPAQAQSTPENTQGICGRTQQVQDAILRQLPSGTRCEDVTNDHLGHKSDCSGQIFALSFGESSKITNLSSGDFAGLTCLEFLFIINSLNLATLPAGLFSNLPKLTDLDLSGNGLTALSAEVFSGLNTLDRLDLSNNQITELPAGIFSGLNALEQLNLSNHQLKKLPAGIFSDLSSLAVLQLAGNPITSLPESIFEGISGDGLDILHLPHEDDNHGVFTLTMRWERIGDSSSEEQAILKLRLLEGAPFNMDVNLSVTGATANPNPVRLSTGTTESGEITVTRNSDAQSFKVITQPPNFPNLCARTLRPCYRGFRRGSPFRLSEFRSGAQDLELRVKVFLEGALE